MPGLRLLAQHADDLPPLSALLQDAILRAGDVVYDPRARRLGMLVRRFCWERADAPLRVQSFLRLEGVLSLTQQHWPDAPETPLALLALTFTPDTDPPGGLLTLTFANATTLRAHLECLDATLEDTGTPWPVRHRPGHSV